MEEFGNVAKARESYKLFTEAMTKGREILQRAGIASEAPPPVPDFDVVFRRLDSASRIELYEQLHALESITPIDALRIWQPLLRRAAGG